MCHLIHSVTTCHPVSRVSSFFTSVTLCHVSSYLLCIIPSPICHLISHLTPCLWCIATGASNIMSPFFMCHLISCVSCHLLYVMPSLVCHAISCVSCHLLCVMPSLVCHAISCMSCHLPCVMPSPICHAISCVSCHLLCRAVSLVSCHLPCVMPSPMYHAISCVSTCRCRLLFVQPTDLPSSASTSVVDSCPQSIYAPAPFTASCHSSCLGTTTVGDSCTHAHVNTDSTAWVR